MSQLLSGVSEIQKGSNSLKSTSHHLSDKSELTDAELMKQVNELKNQVKILSLENEIFEKTIMRLDPALMNGVHQALEYAARLHSNSPFGSFGKSKSSGGDLTTAPSRLLISASRISAFSPSRRKQSTATLGGTIMYGTGPRINVLERSELISQEMELIILKHEKIRKKAAKEHAILEAKLEVISVRVADVDKAVANFQQEVIVEGWDKIGQRIPAEIWIRFMTEWMKTVDKDIDKLRLRTSTLNAQYHALRSQIRAKAELRENLRPVDFEKIKIENDQCQITIEQKLLQLHELKQMTGDANLFLTLHKKAAMEQDNYLNNVLETIQKRENRTVQMNKEREVIQSQADVLAVKVDQIQKVRNKYEAPDVLDYVDVKSELTDLTQSVKALENRLQIAQIAVTTIAKKLNSMYFLRKQKAKKL